MTPEETSPNYTVDIEKAQRFQNTADALTDSRYYLAIPVCALVACTKAESIPGKVATGLVVSLWGTDTFDGFFARKAQALADLPSTNGAERDPKADKLLFYGLAGALIIRALRSRDRETAGIIMANTGVSYFRDRKMKNLRDEAKEMGYPVDAIAVNKAKTTFQAVSSAGLSSSLSSSKNNHQAMLTAYSIGTMLGVVGLFKYQKQINRAKKEDNEFAKYSVVPDFEAKNVKDLTPEWLKTNGFKALSLDVDGTIMSQHGKEIDPEILKSLRGIAEAGIPIAFASNAYGDRARELEGIAKTIHENVIVVTPADISDGKYRDQHYRKPKPDMIIEIANRLGVKPEELLHAGDQQFKDVLSANRAGSGSLLVPKFGQGGDWRVELLQRPIEKIAMGLIRAIKSHSISKI